MPVIALETGQFFLASSAAASNCSAVMPGTTPVTVSLMPVMFTRIEGDIGSSVERGGRCRPRQDI